MRTFTLLIAATFVAATPLASHSAESNGCRPARAPDLQSGNYPEHPLSPYESLRNFDTVFHGEVAVPARKCSLGWCAGIRVLRIVKGQPDKTALVQVGTDSPCGPAAFAAKGSRWLVFANQGTSKTGLRFLHAGDDGPSFAAESVPDFSALEGRYRMLRAQLDQVIGERLGHLR